MYVLYRHVLATYFSILRLKILNSVILKTLTNALIKHRTVTLTLKYNMATITPISTIRTSELDAEDAQKW